MEVEEEHMDPGWYSDIDYEKDTLGDTKKKVFRAMKAVREMEERINALERHLEEAHGCWAHDPTDIGVCSRSQISGRTVSG
jgi:hypothetical protein